MRSIGDDLNVSGFTIQDRDLTFSLLRGLGQSYNAFYASMSSQLENLTFEDVVVSLRSYESHLTQPNEDSKLGELPLSANFS